MLNRFRIHNPDILDCLASLSTDEVFTPPKLVNEMLDMLPQEIFKSTKTTFLDPGCKSGVFLREIAKRLLKNQVPDYEQCAPEIESISEEKRSCEQKKYLQRLESVVENIFKKQLFAIAITDLTAMLSRRSVYCSRKADEKYSICKFNDSAGNIIYKNHEHSFRNGSCKFCGAAENVWGKKERENLENHAYQFTHTTKPEEIFNMKFDVVIGNPPYQLRFGIEGANKANARSIYDRFIAQAILLNPKHLVMITPSRWMTKTAQGISPQWVDEMIYSNHFVEIHDFADASAVFPGVSIEGGVSYFLWSKNYNDKCDYYFVNGDKITHRKGFLDPMNSGIVVRDPASIDLIEKIARVEGRYFADDAKNFSSLVSPKHFFDSGTQLTSNWRGWVKNPGLDYKIKYYVSESFNDVPFGWIRKCDIPKNRETLTLHKVYVPAANGSSTKVLGTPFYGEPNSVCSQTYLVVGYNPDLHKLTKMQCENIVKYIKTRFFRYLVSIKKKTQNGPRGVYQFVPVQDFSGTSNVPWSKKIEEIDEYFFEKYKIQDYAKTIKECIDLID